MYDPDSRRRDALRQGLEGLLRADPDRDRRIAQRELPVCAWLDARHQARDARVVAVNGPQGSGKSTLCALAVEALGRVGVRAVTVSIDDFYLPFDDQQRLAAAHPGDPFLEHRGYPGTHDVALGAAVIDALREDRGAGVRVPVYDKAAHGGRGDRGGWREVRGPFDLVLVEGWMLGFSPVPVEALRHPGLAPANALLGAYSAWNSRCDALLHLVMADPTSVLRWRVEAERARRAAGAPGLNDAEARDYVARFLPAYATWGSPMLESPAVVGPRLVLTLGDDRLPIAPPG